MQDKKEIHEVAHRRHTNLVGPRYVVVQDLILLTGLTVLGGNAGPAGSGAAVQIDSAGPKITNCIFTGGVVCTTRTLVPHLKALCHEMLAHISSTESLLSLIILCLMRNATMIECQLVLGAQEERSSGHCCIQTIHAVLRDQMFSA